MLSLLRRQLGNQVGSVVGIHLLEDVGCALDAEGLHDLDLLLFGKLLEHVGETVVVEFARDLKPALCRHLLKCQRQIGCAHVIKCGEEVLGALLLRQRESVHRRPVHDAGLPLAAKAASLANEELGDEPIPAGLLLDTEIDDRHGAGRR